MDQGERRRFLIRELLGENAQYRDVEIPAGENHLESVAFCCIATGATEDYSEKRSIYKYAIPC